MINHSMLRRLGNGALAVIMLLSTNMAMAACQQSDLTGIWFMNGVAHDATDLEDELVACKIKFGSSGSVLAGASSCTIRYAVGTASLNVTGGKFTLNSSCGATGYFNVKDPIGSSRVKIQSARIDKGKTTMTIVAFDQFEPDGLIFLTAVKK